MTRNTEPLANVRDQIDRYVAFDTERLIKRPEWGEIHLENARIDVERVSGIVGYLQVLPIENLTAAALNKITGALTTINNLFDQVQAFSITTNPNPSGQAAEFIQQIQAQADGLYTHASPWIPFLAYLRGDVDRNITALTTAVSDAEGLITDAKGAIKTRSEEIDSIVTAAREASAAAGAAVFTEDFNNESKEKALVASKWLKAAGTLAVLTLITAWVFYLLPKAGLDQGLIWQVVSTKIVILGIMVTATVWCGRIYKALMHQSTINRHRSLSIQTLQAFAAAVEDHQMRDSVVVEAARSVFSSNQTGYVDGGGSDGDMRLLEIAKNVMPSENG